MRKLLICASVAAALGLTGCGGGETIEEIQAATPDVTPFTRVVFDPAAGVVSPPTDTLMLPGDDGFFDYTLNIPVDALPVISMPYSAASPPLSQFSPPKNHVPQ